MESNDNETNINKNKNMKIDETSSVESHHLDEFIDDNEEDIHIERKFEKECIKRRHSNEEAMDNDEVLNHKKKCKEEVDKHHPHNANYSDNTELTGVSDPNISNRSSIIPKTVQAELHNDKTACEMVQESNFSININSTNPKSNDTNTASTAVQECGSVSTAPNNSHTIREVYLKPIVMNADITCSLDSNDPNSISSNTLNLSAGNSNSIEVSGARGYNASSTTRSPGLTETHPLRTVSQPHYSTNDTERILNLLSMHNSSSTVTLDLNTTNPTILPTPEFNGSDTNNRSNSANSDSSGSEIIRSQTPRTSISFLHSTKNNPSSPTISNGSETTRSQTPSARSSFLLCSNNTHESPIISNGSEIPVSQTPATSSSFSSSTNNINNQMSTGCAPLNSPLLEELTYYHSTTNIGYANNEDIYEALYSSDAEIINVYTNHVERSEEDPNDEEEPNQILLHNVNLQQGPSKDRHDHGHGR